MITFDPERQTRRIAELEDEMGRPGFWDDQKHAAAVSTEHSRLTRRVERYERLNRDYEDARELSSLDGEMADEISASIEPLQRELERRPGRIGLRQAGGRQQQDRKGCLTNEHFASPVLGGR